MSNNCDNCNSTLAGSPIENPTVSWVKRYSRHILLKDVGEQGQRRLNNAKVLVVGAGGLGCPAIVYLAAAGIGKIGVADMDVVDLSNLQRQILHTTQDIGKKKVESVKEKINALNPDVKLITYTEKLTSRNAREIIKDFDIVIDGSDNFPARYLINDACVFERKVLIFGAVFRFEGQVTTIIPNETPCYRCIFPNPPPQGMVPSCQEAGVLGVVPGIIGIIQATEAIKFILNIGNLLKGRLLLYDALSMEFNEVKIKKDRKCRICGENPTINELVDYEEFCNIHSSKVTSK